MDKSVEYKLLEDGRVEIRFKSESADMKKIDNETVIGDFYNMSVCHIENKDICVDDLQEKYIKYSDDLESISKQLSEIEVNDTLAEELKEFIVHTVKVTESIKTVKDYTNEGYVANNPKKFGKMLKEARMLKETVIGELKNIDLIIGKYTKKKELSEQKIVYDKEVTKIMDQLETVREL